ncbi:MAG: YdeI/OmpD-associated family protein, partial [Parafilimonas sp.]
VFMVGINADVREKAGVKGGDKINVEIELDTQPREITLPPNLQKALDKNSTAKKFFETLSYSKKKVYVVSLKQAKTDETRQRRIEKVLSDLIAGKK